jgi:hypothetical protein
VPVVWNGKVYVATVQSLAIFGLAQAGQAPAKLSPPPKIIDSRPPLAPGEHEIRGMVRNISGYTLTIETKHGKMITVDYRAAAAHYKVAPPSVGHAVVVRGKFEGAVLKAKVVGHIPDHPRAWPPDR